MSRLLLLLTAVVTAAAFASIDAQQAARTSPDDTPFYQGITDEASLTRLVEGRLARAQELIDRLVAFKGKRTIENTLRLYDEMQTEIMPLPDHPFVAGDYSIDRYSTNGVDSCRVSTPP